MIGVFVIDDHDIVHAGVRSVTEAEEDISYVGGATSLDEGLRLAAKAEPDLILLDFRIGTEDSLGACSLLRTQMPDVRIMMFSGYGNPSLLAQAIQAGADGYALKDAGTRQLPTIIRECVTNGEYFDPRIAGSLLRAQFALVNGGEAKRQGRMFSERELAIVAGVARGWTTHEIAAELHVSPATVKHDISGLLERFGVRRRAELVRIAKEQQLI